ncbi:MAG: malto-oligosyltrehalose synthase, partial [Acidobacteriales bacterium]|nr:malto-oligosyltrehalose synthase [Terriglobales bacterium]
PTVTETDESRPIYVLIEKILTGDEQLPDDWPVHGTTGYEFCNLVNGLFVDPSGLAEMDRIYRAFIGHRVSFDGQLYRSKKLVMHTALGSELTVLANLLSKIALANRHTCDFTVNSLRDALSRIVACFPVYRTYISGSRISTKDQEYVDEAVECAKQQMSGSDASIFDFIRDVLLTRKAVGHNRSYANAITRFAMKFQQYTSAVMAKGLEDTSFYRYHRLDSLNEVGGDPRRFGISPELFHQKTQERAESWPHSMLDTSTHDSKRSEDARSRINVLSEIPVQWRKRVRRWRELNQSCKVLVNDVEAPSRNDEYLLYQTLLGAWPLDAREAGSASFCQRIQEYMLKAVREAKEKTSWANPNPAYEEATTGFVARILSPSNANSFQEDFLPFQRYVAHVGMFNSLSQTLIKLTAPGVPDLYQGTELWNFTLVDPDNRRTVDYLTRQRLLHELQRRQEDQRALLEDLNADMNDGRIKMYLTWKALQLRKKYPLLFQQGEYVPLHIHGLKAGHVLAFARRYRNLTVMVAVPRLCAQLLKEKSATPMSSEIWGDTTMKVPLAMEAETYRDAFTGEDVRIQLAGQEPVLAAKTLFARFPVALLFSKPSSSVSS